MGANSQFGITLALWRCPAEWARIEAVRGDASSIAGDGATLPIDAVAHVIAGKKLDAKLVKRISTERTLAEWKADPAEIAY